MTSVAGIILQNMVVFGRNIESWNWGMVTVLVTLHFAWCLNKLLAVAGPLLTPLEEGARGQVILVVRVLVAILAVPVATGLWKFEWADVRVATSAVVRNVSARARCGVVRT